MRWRIDPESSASLFGQLRQQITDDVAGGALVPGDRLPTVRSLADQLGIAPHTVARAYRELEADGVLEGRGRAGTFVRASVADGKAASAGASARAAAERYAEAARALGLSAEEALEVVRKELRR